MKYNYEVYGYGKSNLVILLISILLIIVGYLLMAGGLRRYQLSSIQKYLASGVLPLHL